MGWRLTFSSLATSMMNQSGSDFCRSWNGPRVIISMSFPSKAIRQFLASPT